MVSQSERKHWYQIDQCSFQWKFVQKHLPALESDTHYTIMLSVPLVLSWVELALSFGKTYAQPVAINMNNVATKKYDPG
jgi:hypothetical protein